MKLARSTYYDEPELQPIAEARLVEQIKAVCAEWPAYGYRRVTVELHDEGRIVNHKKVMRLMKENDLTVRPRRRFIATTDSNHDGWIQAVVATKSLLAYGIHWSSASAGVFQRSVFRGRALRAAATAAISSALCTLRGRGTSVLTWTTGDRLLVTICAGCFLMRR
jgi:hypothetical protein